MRFSFCNFSNALNVAKLISFGNPKSNVSLKGFVASVQKFGKFYFIKVNDCSCFSAIQVVVPKKLFSNTLNVGSTVDVVGNWVKSTGPAQPMELFAEKFSVIGYNEITPLVTNNDILRQHLHLRAKNPAFASILKLRSQLFFSSHYFFSQKQFTFIDTPMFSQNDCEGAGEVFEVKSFTVDNFFGAEKVFLPVSAQLHLEAISCGIPNVYTIGPTFRADKSLTRQHLAEFRMLEAECAFVDDIEKVCQLVEDFIKFVVIEFRKFTEDLDTSTGLCERTNHILKCVDVDKPIPKISYLEAIALLEERGRSNVIKLSKHHEFMLVDIFKGPVFVINYPAEGKPFYMKRSADGLSVKNFDLLAPFVGELAGGSVRENNYDKLRMRLGNNDSDLSWYLELRKSGYPGSSGFGLGFDRLLQSLCGIENIKDTISFPRWYKHCSC